MSIKLKLFIIGLFTFFPNVHSQEEKQKRVRSTNHFLEIGFGLNNHAIRDQETSPLIYKGILPGIHLQYFLTSKSKFLGIIDENFFLGSLKTRNFDVVDRNRSTSYNNDFLFDALYLFKNTNRSAIYLGGEAGAQVNVRVNEKFNNANLNYEFIASLAPALMYEYKTSWKAGQMKLGIIAINKRERDFKFQYALSVPVINALVRPGYVTINDFVDNNSLAVGVENLKFATLNKLFLIRNRFNLYYILHNGNMLKFNYSFNYFSYYNNFNPVKGFNSVFFVSIVFKFSNN